MAVGAMDGRDGGISIFPGRPRPMYRNVKHDRDRLTKEGEGAADDSAGQIDFILGSSPLVAYTKSERYLS